MLNAFLHEGRLRTSSLASHPNILKRYFFLKHLIAFFRILFDASCCYIHAKRCKFHILEHVFQNSCVIMTGSCRKAVSSAVTKFCGKFWIDFNQVGVKTVQFVGHGCAPGSTACLNNAVLKGGWRVLKTV